MRAAAIIAYGQPPEVIEMPRPVAVSGHALVKVEAAPVNALDLLCATGTSYFGRHPLPYIPGVEGIGTVVEGGALPAGTKVWFGTDAGMKPVNGSMAEFCLVDEGMMTPLPAGIDPAHAAALGLSAVAAYLALAKTGGLAAGEQVLVLGAGAVGRLAMQIAPLLGARRVVVAARSQGARARALELGVAAAVSLAPTPQEIDAELRAALDGRLDLVIDTLAGAPAAAALTVLGQRGRLVNLGSSAGPEVSVPSTLLRSREIAILGYTNNGSSFAEKATAFAAVARWAAAGRVHQDLRALPLETTAEAWHAQRVGSSRKLVLVPGG